MTRVAELFTRSTCLPDRVVKMPSQPVTVPPAMSALLKILDTKG